MAARTTTVLSAPIVRTERPHKLRGNNCIRRARGGQELGILAEPVQISATSELGHLRRGHIDGMSGIAPIATDLPR